MNFLAHRQRFMFALTETYRLGALYVHEERGKMSILHKPRRVALVCLLWLLFLMCFMHFRLYSFFG
jgi:hypothetical protein